MVGNGHLSDNIGELVDGSQFAQPYQLFENQGTGRFRVVEEAGGLGGVRATRGLAGGDFDRDGDVDLVAVNSNDRAEIYQNLSGASAGSWLQVEPVGLGGQGRGVGALLRARTLAEGGAEGETGGATDGAIGQVRQLLTARSYLAQSEQVVHFGLGVSESPSIELLVSWPSGARHQLTGVPANRRLRLFD